MDFALEIFPGPKGLSVHATSAMAGSQLKQLKANLHARRTAKGGKAGKPDPPAKPKNVKPLKRDPKAQADSLRRTTLLPAIQNRHRVGGITDRRIGENDPTMSPEERMLQRYARQRSKKSDAFNLDDDEGEDGLLTHGGRGLFDANDDDFAEGDLGEDDAESDTLLRKAKRRRADDEEIEPEEATDEPERKRSKKEIMEEVMAKSKFYKAERQKTKDDDEDIRDELDKELPDIIAMLRGGPRIPPRPQESTGPASLAVHPDRAAQMTSNETPEEKIRKAEKEYDKSLRQLAMDGKAQPADRTKTDEEKAVEEALRLKELEEKRLRRMRGEDEESESEVEEDGGEDQDQLNDDFGPNEAADFGIKDAKAQKDRSQAEQNFADEDDFVIDEDLVASGSDLDTDFSEDESDATAPDDADADEEEDEDFLKEVMPERTGANAATVASGASKVAYSFPCPESHAQLLEVVKNIAYEDLPTVVQRIRALYHPQLNAQNKEKLSKFASSLIDHVSYLGSQQAPLAVVETLIRHIHSLSKTHAESTSVAFRSHLTSMHERGTLTRGDLYILTAIGSIFPTSDHFHQVVTPAITVMARWLGMTTPRTAEQLSLGAYVVALCIKYQSYSKRYIPEAVRFTTSAISNAPDSELAGPHIRNLSSLIDLYSSKSAFFEIFYPAAWRALKATSDRRAKQHLRIALKQSISARRPLELHHHRPLPIKSSVPKFEEGFNPNKHYDPDRERAESNKLKKEYKRERKGAIRELRKDAAFMHRESLKEKKTRDAEYEKKQRRLIAEIQGEDGREGNAYEREKRKRKGQR